MDQGADAMKEPDYPYAVPPADVKRADVAAPTAGYPAKGARTPEKIQREIEQTRTEMGSIVSAIQNRLAPDQLIEQTTNMTLNAVRQGVPKMMNAIKNNPGPSLLIAAGAGWLAFNALRGDRHPKASTYPDVYYTAPGEYDLTEGGAPEGRPEEREAGGRIKRMKEKIKDKAGTIKDKASQLASQAREKSSQLTEQAKGKTGEWSNTATEKTGQFTDQAKGYLTQLSHSTRKTARRTNDRIWQMIQENPLAVGAMALAVGAAVGLLIPESEKESEMMGESRERVLEQAKATGEDVLEKTKRVAEEATAAAKAEAREQGLTSE